MLSAYIILDKFTHSPHVINEMTRDTLYSKGIGNRVKTLFTIAQKYNVPIWISQTAMDSMNIGSTAELIYEMRMRRQ